MVRRSRKIIIAGILLATASPVVAAQYGQSGDNRCVGGAISFFGPFLAGLFDVMDMFGPGAVGEVASTHCDPSWD